MFTGGIVAMMKEEPTEPLPGPAGSESTGSNSAAGDPQGSLFDPPPAAARTAAAGGVMPAPPTPEVLAMAAQLRQRWGERVRLGTSSWYFPGWAGLVWAREYSEETVARKGLPAYAAHPLMGTVSLDRTFYRPVEAATYARLAAQVPEGFRFMVKAAALVTDATLRDAGSGRALRPNPQFLDPAAALQACVRPAVAGLGPRLGVMLFQLSPLRSRWLAAPAEFHQRLDALLAAVMAELPAGAICALELRDPELLTPELARLLLAHGARFCLGLHDRMPPVEQQLPMLRALWPGPLVCRWNLQRGLAYEQARDAFAPFNKLAAPDPATRQALARVMAATAQAGHPVFVAINNKAEGSAPWSVIELMRELLGTAPSG
jgi:uncharacterized protein YecE (DUF72 family)